MRDRRVVTAAEWYDDGVRCNGGRASGGRCVLPPPRDVRGRGTIARHNRLCVRGHRDLRLNNFGAMRFLGRLKRASEKHLHRGTFFGFLRRNHNAFGNKTVILKRNNSYSDRIGSDHSNREICFVQTTRILLCVISTAQVYNIPVMVSVARTTTSSSTVLVIADFYVIVYRQPPPIIMVRHVFGDTRRDFFNSGVVVERGYRSWT